MSNIVLATDGSPFSDAAARSIVEGRLLKAGFTVHVVHVTPTSPARYAPSSARETIDEWHKEESERPCSRCATSSRPATSFEAHSLRGFAPERIVAHAGETKAEAIVMGTHGRGTFFDAVIGSVAGRVLAMAPCPVLLIKGERAK